MTIKISLRLCVVCALVVSACVPNRMTVYLQDKSGNSGADCEFKKNVQANSKLLPKDELYLRISSFDQDKYNVFSNMQVNSQLGSEGVNLVSYTVSDSGTIRLAMVGDVYVENLTLEEAARKIESALDIYMNQPMVTVKLVDKTITVLGEVNVPGTFSFTKENLTVFQALGYAGGMKPFANRQKVTIMREQQETILKETIDLTNQEVIMSDYYYVLDDDVIYVEPLKRRIWGMETFPYNIILSTAATFVSLYSLIIAVQK